LRWTIGSLDVVASISSGACSYSWCPLDHPRPDGARPASIALDEETAASLGVNVKRSERLVYAASSLIVGVTVAVGAPSASSG
jgi:hypothetical protein